MNRTTNRSISLAAGIVFALSSLAIAAPGAESSDKYYKVTGQVLKIDSKQRTLLIADQAHQRVYLVSMPRHATLKITWGRYMRMAQPGFGDVYNNDRVEIRCFRPDDEHLSQLDDGRKALTLTAASR